MYYNALIIALREIRRNLMRSFLTVLGVIIGVAAVITMVTLGQGATEMVKAQIFKLGSNQLLLRPGQGWGPTSAPLLSMDDVRAIEDQIPGLRGVAPFINTNAPAVYLENARPSTNIQGTTSSYFKVANWEIAEGRFFDDDDLLKGNPVCVIGETIRKELFGKVDALGKKIRVRNTTLTVVGVTVAKGQGSGGDDLDHNIITPLTTLQRRLSSLNSKQSINMIMMAGEDGYPGTSIVADITALMRERRYLSRNQTNNFMVIDTRQIADAMSSSTEVLTSLLGAVAGVSLLVGGIGIMNIMLVSVTERTREIGIRLAIGARAREVLLQFLVEAVTLSCVGGVLGILLAYGLCASLSTVVGAAFVFDPKINLIAFMFSVVIGIIFGFMPARRAAGLDPIEALRHE